MFDNLGILTYSLGTNVMIWYQLESRRFYEIFFAFFWI